MKDFPIGTVVSIILGVFFVLPFIHDWANSFFINFHFCNHLYCMIFSIIFFAIAIYSFITKKSCWKTIIIVLVIGVVLMNITICDASGNIRFKILSWSSFFPNSSGEPGETIVVAAPPCVETDSGRDYISFGTILSGMNVDDICMGNTLRERYCNSETTYTSEDIDCTAYRTGWVCAEGECRASETTTTAIEEEGEEVTTTTISSETNCGDGIDNDNDQLVDCADNDCEDTCDLFDYSCQHISPYPACSGTCPAGEECVAYTLVYNGWCECMPIGNTVCGETYPNCGGWCGEGYSCLPAFKGCTCVFNGIDCYESDEDDNPLQPGYCYDFATEEFHYDECANSLVLFEQKCIPGYGCDTYSIYCVNDTDYGLLDYTCFTGTEGGYCGTL